MKVYLFFFLSSVFQNTYMESRKAVLELKDVPPPPHHTSSSQSSQPFSLAPLPLPPPCLLPPQLPQDSHQQQPPPQQQQKGASPKVSICTQCDYCSTEGYGLLGSGGVVGSNSSIAGVVSLYMAPGSVEAPSSSSSISRSGPCSVTSSVHQYKHILSCSSGGEALDPLLGFRCKPQLPSSVATSQPVSSHPYLPCCSGLLHAYPAVSLPCSQPSLPSSSAPLASSLPSISSLPAPLHGSCLGSSGYYTCGVDCSPSARRSQRSTALGEHPTSTTITTTTTSAHFCSNPMHLNVERTVCVKGAHYCQECLLKVGRVLLIHCGFLCINVPWTSLSVTIFYIIRVVSTGSVFLYCFRQFYLCSLTVWCICTCLQPMNGLVSESVNAWPNVPIPQTTPIPIPICNGCGTSSDSLMLMSKTSLSKTGQKYGQWTFEFMYEIWMWVFYVRLVFYLFKVATKCFFHQNSTRIWNSVFRHHSIQLVNSTRNNNHKEILFKSVQIIA